MPVHAICTYLPSGQAAATTAPAVAPYAYAPAAIATHLVAGSVRFGGASIDTGPPIQATPSSHFVLKI